MTGYNPASAGARVEGSAGRPPVSRPGARQQGHHLEIPEGEGDGEGVLHCSASCRQRLHYCHVSLYYSVKLAVWLHCRASSRGFAGVSRVTCLDTRASVCDTSDPPTE